MRRALRDARAAERCSATKPTAASRWLSTLGARAAARRAPCSAASAGCWSIRRPATNELVVATCVVDVRLQATRLTASACTTRARSTTRKTRNERYEARPRLRQRRAGTRKRWLAIVIGAFALIGIGYGGVLGAARCATRSPPTTPTSAATSCRSRRRSRAPSSAIAADDTQFVKAGQTLVAARPGRCEDRARAGRCEAREDGARSARTVRDDARSSRRAVDMRSADVARATEDLSAARAPRELGRGLRRRAAARARRARRARRRR